MGSVGLRSAKLGNLVANKEPLGGVQARSDALEFDVSQEIPWGERADRLGLKALERGNVLAAGDGPLALSAVPPKLSRSLEVAFLEFN